MAEKSKILPISKKTPDAFDVFYRATIHLISIYLLGLAVFMCFRIAILVSFGNFQELREYKADTLQALWVGMRFDTNILAYGLAVLFLMNLMILFIPGSATRYNSSLNRYAKWYVFFVFLLFFAVLFADYFFYMFFQSHINKLFFGVLDDTRAVMTSVWSDYPTVRLLIFFCCIMALTGFLIRYIFSKEHEIGRKGLPFRIAFVSFLLVLYLIALRGSLGPVPICKDEDSSISPNLFLDDLTLNGVFSLKDAFAEREHERVKKGERGIDSMANTKIEALGYAKTPFSAALKKSPPNVVVLMMESMSNYYLDLHSPQMNLLGSLEKQLPSCIVFRNFLPSGNGTIQSLEGLIVDDIRYDLVDAQLHYIDKSLSSSAAIPFLNAGYHTSFITGSGLNWCNIGKFASKQYFQTVEGSETLMSRVKGAQAGTWGVYDEFLFDRVFSKLEHAQEKPQFIFALSVTNHTPFDLPGKYKPYPLNLPAAVTARIKTDEKVAKKNLTAYQYANDCIGNFLERLRISPYGKNTIVAITGDHNTRQLFNFSYTQMLEQLSVPLILYVPDKYRPSGTVNTSRFGSHKDIFPTLYNLSLSNAKYIKTGDDLFDARKSEDEFFGINESKVVMNRRGCILLQEKPFFYKWQEKDPKLLQPTTPLKTRELAPLLGAAKAFVASTNAYIKSALSRP